jgi:hypothetical protein
VTAQTIQELNGIANPRFIFVGQRLIIRPAPGGASSGGSATPRPTGTRGTSVAALASNTPAQAAETTEEPAEATPEASSTPRILATNTPVPSPTDAATAPVVQVSDNVVDPAQTTASLCALMYEDANQNLGQDNDEQALAGGLFTLNSEGVSIDAKESTVDRVCFEGLAPGDYTVIANAPDGYGVTTPDQLSINLTPGEPLNVAFGAAQGFSAVIPTADAQNVQQPEPAEQAQTQSFTDRLFAISGFLVIGLGVLVIIGGVVATLILRRR